MQWTTEQQKVIDLRDRDILVSAAAGSGKTAVLVERIIQRVTDPKNPIDIDRLLVVTFTKAAAAEMRERIGAAIDQQCEAHPFDAHLRRQSALIHNAMITTIDSFCLFVVRNHFEEISLDPNFRIADEGEIRLLEQDVLDKVFEENYEAENASFLALIDAYSNKRSDQAVRDMVGRLYRMSLSSPWPEEWIGSLAKPYEAENAKELLQSEMVQDLTEHVRLVLADMRRQLEKLHDIAIQPDGPLAYASSIEQDIALLEGADEADDYEKLSVFFTGLKFGNLTAIRKFTGDVLKKEAVQNGRNAIKKEIDDLRTSFFAMDTDTLYAQIVRLRPIAEEMVRLTLAYSKEMELAKRKKRIVDFSDIEHFALRILVDDKTKLPRNTAAEFRAHFAEIMIDEYQDSNLVQEAIMRSISKEADGGHNMFMVGDVKQSIYRFRLARPELFMEKYGRFDVNDSVQQRIDLHQNFRSRKQVVDYCNDIFYKIMNPDLGRVAYDEDAALNCGASYPEVPDKEELNQDSTDDDELHVPEIGTDTMDAELLLVDEQNELLKEQTDLDKRKLEAHLVVTRIRQLMRSSQVTDKATGKLRSPKYSDIVILLRSLKNWGTDFMQVLSEHGIPAHVESSTGYFSALEVQTVLNMLRILDNPYQDIPMAAVLKSEIVGLDEEEMAQVRVRDESVPFAAAALAAMQEEDADEKLVRFYDKYTSLRGMRDLPIHELIQKILDVTGYGSYVAALPAGERREANLAMLIEKAADYEKTSYRGLFHFIRYIDLLQKYEIDFGEAETTGENADVVRIMTIHKSKGLEFPIVFVSGLSKKFNQMDEREKLVVHPDLGMGICEISGQPKRQKNCLFRAEIADKIRRENLGEELRVLYVALTRAKEKLILSGVIKDEAKTLGQYEGNTKEQQPISYRQRVGATCYLDWILPAMLSYPERYTIGVIDPGHIVLEQAAAAAEARIDHRELMLRIDQADEETLEHYQTLFAYEYPYKSEAGKKSKYSVSELKHDSMVIKYDHSEGEAQVPEFLLDEHESYIPDFARDGEDTGTSTDVNRGALRGTAVHRVMECLDFEALAQVDVSDTEAVKQYVRNELDRMTAEGELTVEQADLVIPAMIEGFVLSPVASRMAQAALRGDLYREKPFVMQYEDVLVQGIIDVFWLEEESIVLLDYKTDRVREAQELVMRYQKQLELYADALSRVFSKEGKKIDAKERLIYSFRLQEVVNL